MTEKKLKNEESIDEILNIISNSGNSGEMEFEFGKPTEEEGLVFENSDEPEKVEELSANITFDDSEEEAEDPYAPEFAIPDSFESKNNSRSTPVYDEAPKIRTTYIPRFTGASLNYRMIDDPRPKNTPEAPILPAVNVSTETPKTVEVKKSVESKPAKTERVDPIAEIDADLTEASKITTGNIKEGYTEEADFTSKLFKFDSGDNTVEEVKEENDEASGYSDVLSTIENEPEEENEEDVNEEFRDKAPELATDAKEFFIPDPEAPKPAIIDYAVSDRLAGGPVVEDAPSDVGDRERRSSKRRKTEYSNYAQRDTFKDKFLDGIMSIRVRFFAAAFVFLALLIMESLFAFNVDLPKLFGMATVPGAMAILDLQLVVCLYLLAIPEIIRSVKCLIGKKAVSELYLTVSLVVYAVYCFVVIHRSPRIYPLFGLVFAVFVLSAMGATYFRTTADFTAFKVVSVNGEKKIVDRKFTRNLERENSALDGKIEEHKSKIARIFRTLFVSNFFERSESDSENTTDVLTVLGGSLGAAVVTGIIAYFVPGGIVNALGAFSAVFMMSVPSASVLLHKLPFHYSEKEAESERCAAIGEAAMMDYSGVDVVTFKDTEVFGSEDVNLQRIMLYGNSDNLSKALRQMSALFMNVGGPLDGMFSRSLDRKCSPAQSVSIEADGVSGYLDGKVVLAGNIDYMLRKGVRIPEDEGKVQKAASASTKIMFAAEDGAVYAKFYIRYSFSEEFSMLLPVLEDEGITPLVYTRDPNITGELIKTLTAGLDKIRILKKQDSPFADDAVYRTVSSGVVTTGDKNNAINMLLTTKKYAKLQSRLRVAGIAVSASGAVFALVFALCGLLSLPSMIFAAWQALWCGALHLVSFRTFSSFKG